MAAGEEQKAIHSVLQSLRRSGQEWMRSYRAATAKAAMDAVKGSFDGINEGLLQGYILPKGAKGRFKSNEVIYLRPAAREETSASALWCKWDFAGRIDGVRILFGNLVEASDRAARQRYSFYGIPLRDP